VGGGIVGFTSNPASLLQVNAPLTLGILSHSHRRACPTRTGMLCVSLVPRWVIILTGSYHDDIGHCRAATALAHL
jgi:hypothetical protein